MKLISNEELYTAARAYSQKFANMTPESYADFQHIIAGMTTNEAKDLLNEFTGTALAFYLNKVEGVKAKNPWDIKGLIERFYVPFAGLKQNMYIRGRKPINPKFKNRQDGSSIDPFEFTKGSVEDIYYTFNDDYQNTISIPDFDIKTAVTSANGEASIIQGYMQFLASMYTEWEKTHIANVANEMLNSVSHPLRDSQIEELDFSETVTRDELKNLVATVNNIVEAQDLETTSAFNIANFPKYVGKEDLVFVMRPGLDQTIKTQLLESAFNKEELNMDLEHIVVPNFGGLVPTQDGTLETTLYMVYDNDGRPTDTYTTDEAGTTPYEGDVVWYDPNADVIGFIAEKGLFFIDDQNAYSVEGIHNPAGMYVTYWANKPNVGFHYDMYKNVVVIKKKITPEGPTFSLSKKSVTLSNKNAYSISGTVTGTTNEDTVVYNVSTSNSSVVTGEADISSDYDTFAGTITAQGDGNATITVTATINSETVLTAKLTVHVSLPTPPEPPAEPTIMFTNKTVNIPSVGSNEYLDFTKSNFDSTTMYISPSVSPEGVVSITSQESYDAYIEVRGVNEGIATVTASILSKADDSVLDSDICTVTVGTFEE